MYKTSSWWIQRKAPWTYTEREIVKVGYSDLAGEIGLLIDSADKSKQPQHQRSRLKASQWEIGKFGLQNRHVYGIERRRNRAETAQILSLGIIRHLP